jgi:cbb3-type cytochrome oxidase maturation protein
VEVLYLLIPMSVLLVFVLMALFRWALGSGQFDDLESEGTRILDEESQKVDRDQAPGGGWVEQSDRAQ